MIPNNDKHIYVILDINDTHTCYAPVVAWDTGGEPLILEGHGLCAANRESFPNFGGVQVLQALHGATQDDDLGRYRVTVKRTVWEQPVWEN